MQAVADRAGSGPGDQGACLPDEGASMEREA